MKSASKTKRKGLSSKQLNFLKARLLEKRRELLAKMRSSMDPGQLSEGSAGDDMIDRALDTFERETAYQIAEIESEAVDQINEAIDRIEAGTYGVCEMCGDPIPAARLKALPSATLCVQCKGREEQSQAHGQVAGGSRDRFVDLYDDSFDPERVYGVVRGRKIS